MRRRERPPEADEWDGYEYALDGFASEEEYYEMLREHADSIAKVEEQQKKNGTFSGVSRLDENGNIIGLLAEVPNRICACCGKPLRIKSYCREVCRNCGWKDDRRQAADPELRGESNEMSLNEAKRAFRNGEKVK